MENEIKVGELIRTNDGRIYKLDDLGDEVYLSDKFYNKIVKHSPNLKDLIQEDDFVNGYPVRYITDIDTGINILCDFDLNEMRWIPLEEIDVWYEVVTKEMIESISYKVTKM